MTYASNPGVEICQACGSLGLCCPPYTCKWGETSVSCQKPAWLTSGAPTPTSPPPTRVAAPRRQEQQPMSYAKRTVTRRPVGPPPFPQWRAPAMRTSNPCNVAGPPPAPQWNPYAPGANPCNVIATGPYSANPGMMRNPWPGAEYSGYQAAHAQPMPGAFPGTEYSGYQRNAMIAYGAGIGRQGYGWARNPCGPPPMMQVNPCGAPPQYGPDHAPPMMMQMNPCGPPPQYMPDRRPQYGPDRAPPLMPMVMMPASYGAPAPEGDCADGTCEIRQENPCGCGPQAPQYGPDRAPQLPQRQINPAVISCPDGYELKCVSFGGPSQECTCVKCGGAPYACDYKDPVVTQQPYAGAGVVGALTTSSQSPMRQVLRANPCASGFGCPIP